MLVDETKFTLVAGHGGAGSVSFGKMSVVGADGGNGGVGGDVYIRVTSDLKALGRYPQDNTLTAADGEKGSSKRMSGKNNPSWLDGKSFEPYSAEFNGILKQQIRERDGFRCRQCFRHEEELGYNLTMHHIDFDKKK